MAEDHDHRGRDGQDRQEGGEPPPAAAWLAAGAFLLLAELLAVLLRAQPGIGLRVLAPVRVHQVRVRFEQVVLVHVRPPKVDV
ncbi:hypothetical protein ILP97_06615 [Amycolatopsis sp. H6(2020)]|nr:hypothetical protein [Amycolatopsis sp. H6(2020)]